MPEKDKNHTTWQIKGSAFVQIEMKKKDPCSFGTTGHLHIESKIKPVVW